jgi:general secretion pathway protein G
MKLQRNKGFTLIEVIVVAGIIAILASILIPMVLKEIDESRITKAQADVRSILTSIVVFKKDTAQWPVMDVNCDPNVTLLVGSGLQVSNLAAFGFDAASTSNFSDHLTTDTNGCYNNWKGPYMAPVTADPWGNAYVVNADSFSISGAPVWIISAGPNGLIDTATNSTVTQVDDVGIRLK